MSGEKSAPTAPPPAGPPPPATTPDGKDAFRFLKDLHGRLVDEPLIPGSAFYEPLHEGNIQDDPVARMFTSIAFTPVQSIQLFSGFSGSGKTTELLRLKQRLEQAGFVVVYANALDYLNPAEPVDITELLIVLAAGQSNPCSVNSREAFPSVQSLKRPW